MTDVENTAVPRRSTPVTAAEAKALVVRAFQSVFGATPDSTTSAILVAHTWGIENGRGQAIIQFNWGNLTAGHTWKGPIWRPSWYEEPTADASARIKRLHALMLQGKAPRAFRAYTSHEAGLADYLSMLRRTFSSMYRAAIDGNISAFATAVKASGYCPDCNPPDVDKSLRSLLHEFERDGLFLSETGASPSPAVVSVPPSSPSSSSGIGDAERKDLAARLRALADDIEQQGRSHG